MASDDVTVQVLHQIRDEIRATNRRLDDHIDATRAGFEEVGRKFEEVGRRIVESELRVATEIVGMAGTLHDVHQMLKDEIDLRARVDRCEHDIADLKRRVDSGTR